MTGTKLFRTRTTAALTALTIALGGGLATMSSTPADAADCTQSDRLLVHKGYTSAASVKEAQCRLNAAGNYKLKVDGTFSSSTITAVKDFQKKHGLTADGSIGDATWAKLEKATGTKPAKSANVQKAIAYAEAAQSRTTHYKRGKSGPTYYDCSGLTSQAFAKGGATLPHKAYKQRQGKKKVSTSDRRPGDLVTWSAHDYNHVGIYVGDGLMIDSGKSARGVTRRAPNIYSGTEYYRIL